MFKYNESGDINVTIRLTDLNGTETYEGTMHAHQVNELEIDYVDGGSLEIEIGKKGGNRGTFFMEADNITTIFNLTAILPPVDSERRMGYMYGATLEYVQGNVKVSRNIGK
jgi:hypothetical protein